MKTLNLFYNKICWAVKTKQIIVKVELSLFVIQILKILYRLGYIRGFSIKQQKVLVFLNSKMRNIKKFLRVSKDSKRQYVTYRALPLLLNGVFVLSTHKGILTSLEASKLKVGGEILFYIC